MSRYFNFSTDKSRSLFISILCFVSIHLSLAQDMHFSQFFAMPIQVNPANAGIDYDLDIGIIHRSQWGAVAQPFTSYGISVSGKPAQKKRRGSLGLGFDCYYDKSGDASFVSLQSGFNIAYSVKLDEYSSLSAGIKLNYNQRSINNTAFQWGEQYDGKSYNASLATGEQLGNLQRLNFFDVAGGLNYRYKKGEKNMSSNTVRIFDIGISGFHINKSDVAFYKDEANKLGTRAIAYFQGTIGIDNTNVCLLPKAYFQMQGSQKEYVAGMLVSIKPKNESKVTGYVLSNVFNIGALYRGKDAVIAVMQYEIRNYVIGLSYDINVSKLTSSSSGRGAYEISLRYINPSPYLRKGRHKRYGSSKFL